MFSSAPVFLSLVSHLFSCILEKKMSCFFVFLSISIRSSHYTFDVGFLKVGEVHHRLKCLKTNLLSNSLIMGNIKNSKKERKKKFNSNCVS